VTTLLVIIHVLICFILIVAVLLQSGKSADLAGAFGGAGSQTVFGPRGAGTLLSKITTICAVLFMVTSLALWFLSSKGTKSVINPKEERQTTQPAAVPETKQKPAEEKAQAQAPEKKQEKEQKSAEPVKKK
jgi:preprotein translocase subunit SecG